MSLYSALHNLVQSRFGKKQGVFYAEVTLDGSNPTPVQTGLKLVRWANACLKKSTADAAGAANVQAVSVDYAGAVAAGVVNVYGWGSTATADTAQAASTNAARVVTVIAIGDYGEA